MGQQVTEGIRDLILSGQLPPGSRIGQEDLALRFGTSRIPVREALKTLESDGLVILVPHSGARVAKLDLQECLEVYKIREHLEPLAVAESVGKLTDEQIAELERLVVLIEKSEGVDEFLKLDSEFHKACYQSSNMPRLIAIVDRLWNSTRHYRRAFMTLFGPRGDSLTHYEHRLLLAAIKRKDATDAERILAGHIRRTRTELDRHREIFQQTLMLSDSASGH